MEHAEGSKVPESAMVIVAHPDDAEFRMGGTVAAWTKAGCRITYVLCTDGSVGSQEPGMTCEKLARIRRSEERAAGALLGVSDIVFLGYDDGQLLPTLDLRRDLVRVIRQYKPEVVLTLDPTDLFSRDDYINHPDHRAAGLAAIDAVAPASEMPLLWPELGSPHRVAKVYVHSNQANIWVDITETIDQKIAAMELHASQLGGNWHAIDIIKKWNAQIGHEKGLAYAEKYRVIVLR